MIRNLTLLASIALSITIYLKNLDNIYLLAPTILILLVSKPKKSTSNEPLPKKSPIIHNETSDETPHEETTFETNKQKGNIFEEKVLSIYSSLNYTVKSPLVSSNPVYKYLDKFYAADILAYNNTTIEIIQCKDWTNKKIFSANPPISWINSMIEGYSKILRFNPELLPNAQNKNLVIRIVYSDNSTLARALNHNSSIKNDLINHIYYTQNSSSNTKVYYNSISELKYHLNK